MLRPLAGVFDIGDGSGRDRAMQALPRAVPGDDVQIADGGAVVVAARGGVSSTDGVICAIDGGVYNAGELALELGLNPSSSPETVLAAGFCRWGVELAPRLRGEFVALIWDRRRERGLLIPDPLGIGGLFVRGEGQRLWFGSEVRNVLPLLRSRPAPDPVALSHWLAQRSAPGGATLYEGIWRPPLGHLIELRPDGWAAHPYWQLKPEEPLRLPRDELVEELRTALMRAVQRRVTPGAPTGVLMSGGLDSTSVAALAHEVAEDGAVAFSATFPDYPHIDESVWVDEIESATGIPTVRHPARGPGLLASGLEYMLQWSLPLHAWSEAWIQPLLRGAPERGVSVLLDGDGGDEMFGSRYYLIADLMLRGRFLSAARFARGLPEFGGRAPRKVFANLLWHYGVQGVPPASVEALWERLMRRGGAEPWWASKRCARLLRSGGSPSWRDGGSPRWWAFCSYTLTEGPHAFGLLDHVRRRAGQAGLEARHPLYDLDLLDLMLKIPPELCSEGNLTQAPFPGGDEGSQSRRGATAPRQERLRSGHDGGSDRP